MRRMTLTLSILGCGALLAQSALAGITMTTVTTGSGPNAAAQAMTADAWVSGAKTKVEIRSSGNPILGKGMWLLTQDAGKTMLLVNPQEKTYARFDLEGMLGGMATMMKAMGPMAKMTFSKPQVEKLLEEAGPNLHGLSTTHYKFRSSYAMNMQVMMMKISSTTETLEEIWATDALNAEAGMGAWMRKGFKTGDESFDSLLAAEMEKVVGFPLKRVAVVTTTDDKGKKTTTTTTTEVTALERGVAIPDSTFALPSGYQETQLLPAGMPPGMGGN